MKEIKIKPKNRMKGDNLILYILIIIMIAVALLVGANYGYEFGRKQINKYYSAYLSNYCVCYEPLNLYKTERFIPTTMLNLSVS